MKKVLLVGVVIVAIALGAIVTLGYQYVKGKNVSLKQDELLIQIPTNTDFEQLKQLLIEQNILDNPQSFDWVAKLKRYGSNVRSGQYAIKNGWSNNQLINHLRGGQQQAQKVTFNNIRLLPELAGAVAPYFEFDSLALNSVLQDTAFFNQYNLQASEISTLFIPNTYQMYWNTTAEGFVKRMAKEHTKFWNDERKAKAEKQSLTPTQVSILASIVQQEVMHKGEAPKVAGLYLNRLKINMALQADPTLKYAANDFSITRVLNEHKTIDSPYNTYMYPGLPPGPICIPDVFALDAVLNPEKHDYLYMCAKEDFSGYHNFGKTNRQHERNARLYRRELNKRKIFR